MVDSSDALTPGPAVGLPEVVSAGQTAAHSRLATHVFRLPVSLPNRYTVKPAVSTRILPRLVRRSWILAARLAWALGWAAATAASGAPIAALASRAGSITLVRFMGLPPSSRGSGSLVGSHSRRRTPTA